MRIVSVRAEAALTRLGSNAKAAQRSVMARATLDRGAIDQVLGQ